jgi:putative flippase GtrA
MTRIPLRLPELGRLVRDRELRRFALFLAVGLLNTGVGYILFVLLHALGAGPALAVIGATILGLLFNFVSTGRIVFASAGLHLLPRFIGVYAVQCAANIVLLHLLVRFGVPLLVAEALILAALAVATFFAMRRFVFSGAPPRRTAAS